MVPFNVLLFLALIGFRRNGKRKDKRPANRREDSVPVPMGLVNAHKSVLKGGVALEVALLASLGAALEAEFFHLVVDAHVHEDGAVLVRLAVAHSTKDERADMLYKRFEGSRIFPEPRSFANHVERALEIIGGIQDEHFKDPSMRITLDKGRFDALEENATDGVLTERRKVRKVLVLAIKVEIEADESIFKDALIEIAQLAGVGSL